MASAPGTSAAVVACLSLGWPLFGLLGGALADRHDRRAVFASANARRALALGILLALWSVPEAALPAIFAAAFVFGLGEVLADTAVPGIVKDTVPVAARTRVNGRIAAASTSANDFVGPLAGAFLLGLHPQLALGCLVLVLVAAVQAGRLVPRPATRGRGAAPRPTTLAAEVVEGLRYLLGHAALLRMAVAAMGLAGGWAVWLGLMPCQLEVEGSGGAGYRFGLLLMGFAAGGLIGAGLTVRLVRVVGAQRLLLADVVGTAGLLTLSGTTAALPALLIAAFAAGFGGAVWNVIASTLRQNLTDEGQIGRVTGPFRLVAYASMPVAALLAG